MANILAGISFLSGLAEGNTVTIILGVMVALLTWYIWSMGRPKGVPPGPIHVPIIGSMAVTGAKDINTFVDLSKKYGRIYSMFMGNKLLVMLNDFEAVKEAFVSSQDCAGRPEAPIQKMYNSQYPHPRGIIEDNISVEWKNQRNNALNIMRNMGWGKSGIEAKIMEECVILVEELKNSQGKPHNPANLIEVSVSNIICSMLFGQRYNHTDEEFKSFIKSIDDLLASIETCYGIQYIPWLFPFIQTAQRSGTASGRKLEVLYHRKINEAMEKVKSGDTDSESFLTLYIRELQKAENKSSKISENWLMQVTNDFFIAGSETTASTLKWALMFMVNNPDIQKKIQDDIDDVCGDGPYELSLSDREKLPYIEATLCEVARIGTILPFSLPHNVVKDTTISGYRLPKGTEVWANLYCVHHDEKIWPEPHAFKPERFLGDHGEFIKKEQWIPFSMGRRTCLGEQLAKQELFLFFANIMRYFTICLPPGCDRLDEEGVMEFVRKPKPYQICFKPRC